MPYFLLSGTISSRISLVTAWSETARFTPISSPQRSIAGTTPLVESVMRRFDRARPSPSMTSLRAPLTLSKLYSGSPIPIMTMLVSSRPSEVYWALSSSTSRPAIEPLGHSPRASRASMTWPTISPGVRLRTRRIVPVWQKRQFRVQPTWLDTQSVPRSASGMKTISNSWPSDVLSSHLRVPSVECWASTTSGRPMKKRSASHGRMVLAISVIASKSVTPRW